MKYKNIILILFTFIVSFIIFYFLYLNKADDIRSTVIPPTCVSNGYTMYEKNGKTQYKNIIPALGHQFNNWIILQEPNIKKCGTNERVCEKCGEVEVKYTYLNSSSIIALYGDISKISKTNDSTLKVEFIYDNIEFNGYATLKYQGHSSLMYDKKNFTIKFFEDLDCTIKNKFELNGWNPEHKFILRANYIDTSRIRNLICSDIWSQMVSTRLNVSERLLNTSNNGAVDGFPVPVYLNGEFIGMYVLSLHKDDDLFEMKDDRQDGIVIINKNDNNESLFKQVIDWENTTSWEVEYYGTDNDLWLKQKLNRFIEFIINSSDADFKNNINNYVDLDSLIDYMIAMYTLGLHTNYSKDLIFITYDNDVFIASMFDMENAFGLLEQKEIFSNPEYFIPVFSNGSWSSQTGSLLWDRILNIFYYEITIRYKELRTNVLSENNLIQIVKTRSDSVDIDYNNADFELYKSQPFQNINHYDQIINYLNESLFLLDEIFINNKFIERSIV